MFEAIAIATGQIIMASIFACVAGLFLFMLADLLLILHKRRK